MSAAMPPPMTPRRLDWLLRARGPDIPAWPEPDRQAAQLLLRADPAARRLLADHLAGDDLLPEPDPAALRRMQGTVRRALSPPPPLLRGIRWGAVAACMAAGLYLGLSRAEPDPALPDAPSPIGFTLQSGSPATVLAALDE